jgi:hypothetical protein
VNLQQRRGVLISQANQPANGASQFVFNYYVTIPPNNTFFKEKQNKHKSTTRP